MGKYLVDTTVFIDHLRGKKQATEFLKQEGLVVSLVTVVELIQGSRNKAEQKKVKKLVDQFEIHWGSARINRLAVELLGKYFLKFNLCFLDALVGATALESNLVLATDNVKHFEFISGLKAVRPADVNLYKIENA